LAFGLVNIPVALFRATEDRSLHFHQVEHGTVDRIRYRRVNERTGKEVPIDQIDRAADIGDNQLVALSEEDFASVAPERSQSIDVADFVSLDEIDPIFFDETYYIGPRGKQASRPYGLLLAAMAAAGKVGVAIFVMRGRERLVAVRPLGSVLVLQTMFFADEVRDAGQQIGALTWDPPIDALSTHWDPTQYRAQYREQLEALVEAKARGSRQDKPLRAASSPNGQVVDLMDALRASLAGQEHASARTSHRSRRRRAVRAASVEGNIDTMSKSELSELAKELHIAGRSSMRRDELQAALRTAMDRRRTEAS